jgi:hypothetical protein
MHSLRYDLALARYEQASERWLEGRMAGVDLHPEVDRLRRAFRREEKRERKRTQRADENELRAQVGQYKADPSTLADS